MNTPLLVLAIIADVLGGIVAVLLIRKYRAARSKPLLYMLLPALALIAYTIVISFALALGGVPVVLLDSWDTPVVFRILLPVCLASYYITASLFVVRIFRAREPWAQILFGAQAVAVAAPFMLPYLTLGAANPSPVLAGFGTKWIYIIGTTSVWGWAAYECFTHWRAYRGDLKAGNDLEPLVVNRFFLWGLTAGGMSMAALLAIGFDPGRPGDEQPVWVVPAMIVCTLIGAVPVYFSWLPPQWYRARFESA